MDTDARYTEAMAHIEAGREDDARRLLAQVVQANPKDEDAWLALALVVPEMDQAIDCLTRVLALNPDNEEAQQYLERAQLEKARDDAAREGGAQETPGANAHRPKQTGELPSLGRYLLEAGALTPVQLEAALAYQKKLAAAGKPVKLGEILVDRRIITQAELDSAVKNQFGRFHSLFWD